MLSFYCRKEERRLSLLILGRVVIGVSFFITITAVAVPLCLNGGSFGRRRGEGCGPGSAVERVDPTMSPTSSWRGGDVRSRSFHEWSVRFILSNVLVSR